MKLIDVSTKKYHNIFAKVSDEDYEELSRYIWTVSKHKYTFYAYRNQPLGNGKRISVAMHRQIMGVTKRSQDVDHRDHDGLNNTRENLRRCSESQNMQNQRPQVGRASKFKGVRFCKFTGRWTASIQKDRRKFWLGRYDDEIMAAEAYDCAAHLIFGEFAHPNVA